MSTNLEQITGAIAEFDRVSAGIAALASLYGSVIFDVTTTDGMVDARAARAAIREPRYEVEKVRKGAKAPLLALGKQIDAEAARITSELLKLEAPIDAQIKGEEERKEAEKQARIAAELARVARIQERIAEIRGAVAATARSTSAALILEHIGDIERIVIDETFEEFRAEAELAKRETLDALHKIHATAAYLENEQARVKAERAELARLRADEEARQNAVREKQAADDRRLFELRDAEDAERQARIAAEDAALEARRLEVARQEMAARMAREAAAPKPVSTISSPPPTSRPSFDDMVDVLARHYGTTTDQVLSWLVALIPEAA